MANCLGADFQNLVLEFSTHEAKGRLPVILGGGLLSLCVLFSHDQQHCLVTDNGRTAHPCRSGQPC